MISLSHVSASINGTEVLHDITLDVAPQEFVFVIGPSGAGKSTLLRLLNFDLLPSAGDVRVREFLSREMTSRRLPMARRHLGVVFQDFRLLEDRNAFENVAVALYVTNTPRKKIRMRVLDVLAEVGLGDKRDKLPSELSVGEQQRLAIARAVANEPYVLLADEPTANLDPQTAKEIVDLLKDINRLGTSVIMATHDYDLLPMVQGATIVKIDKGRLVDARGINV